MGTTQTSSEGVGFGVASVRDMTPVAKSQMEKKLENNMETWVM